MLNINVKFEIKLKSDSVNLTKKDNFTLILIFQTLPERPPQHDGKLD